MGEGAVLAPRQGYGESEALAAPRPGRACARRRAPGRGADSPPGADRALRSPAWLPGPARGAGHTLPAFSLPRCEACLTLPGFINSRELFYRLGEYDHNFYALYHVRIKPGPLSPDGLVLPGLKLPRRKQRFGAKILFIFL